MSAEQTAHVFSTNEHRPKDARKDRLERTRENFRTKQKKKVVVGCFCSLSNSFGGESVSDFVWLERMSEVLKKGRESDCLVKAAS